MNSLKASQLKAAVALTAAGPNPDFEKQINAAIDGATWLDDEVVNFKTFYQSGKWGYEINVEDGESDKLNKRIKTLVSKLASAAGYSVEMAFDGSVWIVVGEGKTTPPEFKKLNYFRQ